jgi:hypothetical protein
MSGLTVYYNIYLNRMNGFICIHERALMRRLSIISIYGHTLEQEFAVDI